MDARPSLTETVAASAVQEWELLLSAECLLEPVFAILVAWVDLTRHDVEREVSDVVEFPHEFVIYEIHESAAFDLSTRLRSSHMLETPVGAPTPTIPPATSAALERPSLESLQCWIGWLLGFHFSEHSSLVFGE